MNIKTLVEKKYFELSPDTLEYQLSAYSPGVNYTLSMDKAQLLKAVIDLQDSHAMIRCHLFLSNILKLNDDFEKMIFLVMVLKLTHPNEYINDRLLKLTYNLQWTTLMLQIKSRDILIKRQKFYIIFLNI